MSRTFKDRPYALIEDEARSRGSVTLIIADGFTGSMSESQNMRIHGRGIRIFRHVGGRIGGGLRTIGIRITGIKPESVTH